MPGEGWVEVYEAWGSHGAVWGAVDEGVPGEAEGAGALPRGLRGEGGERGEAAEG